MATLSQSDSRRLYSWWWDSHVPKNSKWLQENLTDMDAKVKAMIKLIEEDADSFARRAEMYYKKRPELMKLVEEFYRAYRALAERYDHLTGELRHTQRTIAAAFPNQLPFPLFEDSPARSSASDGPQLPHALLSQENRESSSAECDETTAESGLQKLLNHVAEYERLQAEALQLSNENKNLKAMSSSESQRLVKSENEIHDLKRVLADVQAEKDTIFLQYQICLEKMSNIEADLHRAENDSLRLNEQKVRAQTEVETMKQALANLEVEKEAALVKQQESIAVIADLKGMISHAKENLEGLSTRLVESETEFQYLTNEISRLESEKEAGIQTYKLCLEKISYLEGKIPLAEGDAELFKQKAERAEDEVNRLRKSIAELTVEKEYADLQYRNCLKRISELETELSHAQENVKRLSSEVEMEAMKRKSSEQKCSLLEISKRSLRQEADDLAKKIAMKDEELSRKQKELERLEVCLQDEHSRCTQIEATLQALQTVHYQAQADHEALALEVKSGLQMLKDMEICRRELEDEVQRVKDENHNLQEERVSSTASVGNLQNEILQLKTIKSRLEEEVIQQTGQTNSLQREISSLMEEIRGLNERYWALVKKLKSVGLNPETIEASVKNLQDENLRLRNTCESECNEKGALSKKLEDMEEVSKKNDVLERSLSQLNGQLEASRREVREMEETSQFLLGEKSVLVSEKAGLLGQLQTLTENLQKALGNNAILENSLSVAKIELEGLREKSKGLEEICHLLKSEKSDLLTQRETLVVQLANVERRMEYLEHKYAGLEGRHADLEKVNKYLQSKIQELELSLSREKQERTNSAHRHETLLVNAEQHIHILQEENMSRTKEYEDELDKAARAEFELFVFQKCIQDMVAKNCSLLIEGQKYVEASKLAEKLISELERENLEQEVEAELLIDEIEKLRLGTYRVFKVLEAGSGHAFQEKIANEQMFVHQIIGSIEEMKRSLSKNKDDKQLLQVENAVLSTLLGQMASERTEIQSKKELLEKELSATSGKLLKEQNDKDTLHEINRMLKSQVNTGDEQLSLLQADMSSLSAKHGEVEKAYLDLLENYFQLLDENRCLLQECSDLGAEKCLLEDENDDLLLETLAFSTLTTVLESFANENSLELSTMYEVLYDVTGTKDELEKDMEVLKGNLELKEEENTFLEDVVHSFELEVLDVKDALRQSEDDLLEAERKLHAEEAINLELANSLDVLKTKFQESSLAKETLEHCLLEISEDKNIQHEEILGLREVNGNLLSELSNLREECEEHRSREESLSTELEAKDVELEVWEAEAAAFYFDLQISTIQGVLYENKVHELTEVCGDLEDQTLSRAQDIQEMKEKLSLMESEVGELKAELSAYAPVIAFLRDDVTSLEHNTLLRAKLMVPHSEIESVGVLVDSDASFQDKPTDDRLTVQTGLQDLQKLQLRIKAVEKTMVEDIKIKKLVAQDSLKVEGRQGTVMNKIKELKPHGGLIHRKVKEKKEVGINLNSNVKLLDVKPEVLVLRKGSLMKDIPLDQISESPSHRSRRRANSATERVDDKVLELWAENNGLGRAASFRKKPSFVATPRSLLCDSMESTRWKIEHPATMSEVEKELGVDKLELSSNLGESNQAAHNMKILERLASDARRLTSLQFTVENLSKKLDSSKKRRKVKDVDLDTVKEQLEEVQETVYQLVELNGRLMGNVDESLCSPNEKVSGELREATTVRRNKVSEQARKGSEKIGRLQVEVQKIEYILLKLEEEKKSKGKGKFSKNRTTIILRDFIYNGRKNSGKKRKSRLCGCFRSSSSRDQNRM